MRSFSIRCLCKIYGRSLQCRLFCNETSCVFDERYLSPAVCRRDSSQTQVDVTSAVPIVRGQRAWKDSRIRRSQGGLEHKNAPRHTRLVTHVHAGTVLLRLCLLRRIVICASCWSRCEGTLLLAFPQNLLRNNQTGLWRLFLRWWSPERTQDKQRTFTFNSVQAFSPLWLTGDGVYTIRPI